MAIYHFSAQIIGRSVGRSSVAAAAYRAGAKMVDARTGEIHDFTRKGGVFHDEIMVPSNAPTWMLDRSELWNHVEQTDRRKDAQLCREFNVALPRELDRKQQLALARAFVQREMVDKGMVVQLNLHDLEGENPHFHVMATTRTVESSGFGKKERSWNSKEQLQGWRVAWANLANAHLELAGLGVRIDHRSLREQGMTMREAAAHLGPHAAAVERRTGQSSRIRQDRQVADREVMGERAREAAVGKCAEARARACVQALQTQVDQARLEISMRISAERPSADLTLEAEMIEHDMRQLLAAAPAVVGATSALKEATTRHDRAEARVKRISLIHQKVEMLANKAQCSLACWPQEHPIRAWFHRRGLRQRALVVVEQQAQDAACAMRRVTYLVDQSRQTYAAAVAVVDQVRNRLDQVCKVEIEVLRSRGLVDFRTQVEAAVGQARQRECAIVTKREGIQREHVEICRLAEQERSDWIAHWGASVAQDRSRGQVPRAR
ncbi:MobQ family relaxase [Bordetella avium]|uniref:MobQ family relaxase n=1 Tax=Bordetella avium TaxID=521 RepID=UPI0011C05B74|nr:MobQ family relaxase [Bordetella avium]WQE33244.1 MobQ family relaxase [Bordetella avium]